VQADPIKSMLKSPGNKHLKLKCDILLSTSAYKINLRRYSEARTDAVLAEMKRSLTLLDNFMVGG